MSVAPMRPDAAWCTKPGSPNRDSPRVVVVRRVIESPPAPRTPPTRALLECQGAPQTPRSRIRPRGRRSPAPRCPQPRSVAAPFSIDRDRSCTYAVRHGRRIGDAPRHIAQERAQRRLSPSRSRSCQSIGRHVLIEEYATADRASASHESCSYVLHRPQEPPLPRRPTSRTRACAVVRRAAAHRIGDRVRSCENRGHASHIVRGPRTPRIAMGRRS